MLLLMFAVAYAECICFSLEVPLSSCFSLSNPKRAVFELTYDESAVKQEIGWLPTVSILGSILHHVHLKYVTRYAVNLMVADGLGPIFSHGDFAQSVHNKT